MNLIRISSINFETLERLNIKNSAESTLYVNKSHKTLYKIYSSNVDRGYKKRVLMFMELFGELPHVIKPDTVIRADVGSAVEGCAMRYIDKSIELKSFFSKYESNELLFHILIEISKTLKTIHDREIIYGDLNFRNILLDNNLKHYFCDFDSLSINGDFCSISNLLNDYINYQDMSINRLLLSQNTDRLTMYLYFLGLLSDNDKRIVTDYKYCELKELFPFLERSKSVFEQIKCKTGQIPEIPYLHEIIPEEYHLSEKKLKKYLI